MKKVAIVALLSALAATPALAGQYYIAGDLGSATYSNVSQFPNPNMIQIAVGSHFSPDLSGEIGYTKFGDSTFTGPGGSATLSATAFQVAAIGRRPLNSQFDLTGKLGISHNIARVDGTVGTTGDASHSGILFGVGIEYYMSSEVSFRAQYDYYGKFENASSPMKASVVSLGVVYNFL